MSQYFARSSSFSLFFLLFLLLALAAPAEGQYAVLGSSSTAISNLERTEILIQDGPNAIDRFTITRLAKAESEPGQPKAIVLLLPALGIDFASYEDPAPRKGIGQSIAGYFARRNLIVYGYSSRAEGLPAGSCEGSIVDCSTMADWDMQTLVEDIAFVRGLIGANEPDLPVFVGGHSLGAISATATVNAAPNDYAGLILFEGTLVSADPAVQALNQAYCAGLEAQIAAGFVYDGFGNNMLKKVAELAEKRPDSLSPNPVLPPFLTNYQALALSLISPAPGPFSMPVPGYVLANGNPPTAELFHASDRRLYSNIASFNDYVPLPVVRDLACAMAGSDTTHSSNLAAFDGPILGIGGALAYGPYIQDTIDLTSSTDSTVLIEPGFGHIDHLVSADHRQYVEEPIHQWILDRLN